MIDVGNILIPYHIQAKRQQEAFQKEALRRQIQNPARNRVVVFITSL